jgi:hypothetical protein
MSIIVIDSEWCETPMECPQCGDGFTMYSDGLHPPCCPECGYQSTAEEVYRWLITSESRGIPCARG